ncbi:MAG: NADH-quinone oxidoreductase subunit E [Actinobacteria bacterium ADurb.BinA094]|jgi:NADH-quinone oxidoreductase subunit E|nr:MAG: NADH-quinone oxidoreductase subunit E [Actinobacteria bacterium ADurb.BinA094]
MSLSDDEIRQLDGILGHYPDRRAAAATAMRLVQARRRWLSDETMADLGEYLGLTVAELDSIATFGNMIFRKPVGRHVVLVCDSFACWSLGYAELRAAVEAQLGIRMGQTTPDRRFTLLPIVCLGACDRGPAMMVDADLYGPVDPDAVAEILRGYT